MKKATSIVLTITLIFMSFLYLNLFSVAKGDTGLSIESSSNYVSDSPELKLSFVAPSDLSKGDPIEIVFDENVPIGENLQGRVFVNGVVASAAFQESDNSIIVSVPSGIAKDTTITITFLNEVIQNSSTAGYYEIAININGQECCYSYYHVVATTTLSNVSFEPVNEGFKLMFYVGKTGSLGGYSSKIVSTKEAAVLQVEPKDYINIRFSSSLSRILPDSFSFRSITINGSNPPINPTMIIHFENTSYEEKEISIVVPYDIYMGEKVEIIINSFTQPIVIPENLTGDFFVRVWTSKEPTAIKSNVVVNESATYLKTAINLTPNEPDGNNGFYISHPTVSFSVDSGNKIGKVETFVSIDGSDFESYTEPFVLSDGNHTLKYYSVGYVGSNAIKEDVQEFTVKVDSKKPVIEVKSALNPTSRIYTLQASVSDDNLKEVSVKLDSILFYPSGNVITIPTILFDTNTPVVIRAIDYAGNVTEYDCTVALTK